MQGLGSFIGKKHENTDPYHPGNDFSGVCSGFAHSRHAPVLPRRKGA
jgi:hypothetical protein